MGGSEFVPYACSGQGGRDGVGVEFQGSEESGDECEQAGVSHEPLPRFARKGRGRYGLVER